MSSEANVAQLQDLLERVQRNRLRLAELRSRPAAEEAPEVETKAMDVPAPIVPTPIVAAPIVHAPIVPAPIVHAPIVPTPIVPAPVLPAPVEPAAAEVERRSAASFPIPIAEPAKPVSVLEPIEPEPELEPLPDEEVIAASEPFEEVVSKPSPRPPIAEAPAAPPDLSPRQFAGSVTATGPIAELTGVREIQRSWSLDAVLFRAWRLGRDGGPR
jgi:hypothetical protein